MTGQAVSEKLLAKARTFRVKFGLQASTKCEQNFASRANANIYPLSVNSPTTGPELKRWRKIAGLTQDELGRKLGVTREWIGQLESNDRPISASIFLKLEALKRELYLASGESAKSRVAVADEDQAGRPETLRTEIRKLLEKTISSAGDDVARLGWIREQLLRHADAPEYWNIHERVIKQVLEEEEEESKKEEARSQSARSQGKAS